MNEVQAVQLVVGPLLGAAGTGLLFWAAKSVVAALRERAGKYARHDEQSRELAGRAAAIRVLEQLDRSGSGATPRSSGS